MVLLATFTLSSCNYLEFDQSSAYDTAEEAYATIERTEQHLTQAYTYLDTDFGSINGATRDCATDDAYYVWSSSTVHEMNDNRWSSLNTIDSKWSNLYQGIRTANQFIVNFQNTDFSAYEHNTDYPTWVEYMQYWEAEARFLRSYFIFELAKRYGDIINPKDSVYEISEVNDLTKSSFDEIVEYIAEECSEIAEQLPLSRSGALTGRITKGAALALKARALLYAASPLHTEDDSAKWVRAAEAAAEVIDLGQYSLVSEESVNNANSVELILERRTATSYAFESLNFPNSFENGGTGVCPTQELVDAFETTSGHTVTLEQATDGSGTWEWKTDASSDDFNPQLPYTKRDSRFYKTILYDGVSFKGVEIETESGGLNDPAIYGASPTGYYLKKYIIEDVSISAPTSSQIHTWVLFRYAEMVLAYAEAMNEAYGPTGCSEDDPDAMTALEAINLVRVRASQPAHDELDASSEETFRTLLQREKRVEFALEGHRFWDVRRWMIGESTQSEISGVNIVEDETISYRTFERVVVQQRSWAEKKNLYPIPIDEIYKNSNLNPQNTGW